ncbi:transmembrane protein 164-like [Asterias rubens]|uniref:transmembrane protein 164-like n=1 Tax=Asterias rubens TaxID=7604 RepID=UPI001455566F|nr:transmembrane protein 164-like [Asterias rubens]XP_033638232.1 transmembrane protein 164-like [Asterias rubens]
METIASYLHPAAWEMQWLCKGVNPQFPGNGGPECASYLGFTQRILETILVLSVCAFEMWITWPYLKIPTSTLQAVERHRQSGRGETGKRVLLIALCIVLGVELGLKFATKTVIYMMNPCHVITIVEIFLLAMPPSKMTLIVFRFLMSMLSGPFLAIIFPVLNTRFLSCEVEWYWVQHILIYIIIPPFLMSQGGAYTCEPLLNFSWCMFSTGAQFVYHFIPLQFVGMYLEVNLNNMLCPALTDPFHGSWYRMCALVHQHLLLPVHLKIYTGIMRLILPVAPDPVNGDISKDN